MVNKVAKKLLKGKVVYTGIKTKIIIPIVLK